MNLKYAGMGVYHLLFHEDTLLFLDANEDQANVINNVLRWYEKGTIQLINHLEYSMMFGSACSQVEQERVQAILQVGNVAHEDKYLGLPTPARWISKDKFKTTKERLSKKFTSCAETYMSARAKEVLIKCQAILTYVMGVFKLPTMLCEEMTRMIRYFWWGKEDR
jgi:hypothetical protein